MAYDAACPVGIRPAELALDMRTYAEGRKPKQWKVALFGSVFARPERLEWATLPLRLYEKTGLRRAVHALGVPRLLTGRVRDLEAMLPRMPRRPLRRVLPEVSKPAGEEKRRVGFFLGCAQSLLFAKASAAAVRVLTRNGCTVVTPRETVCCGMPAKAYGRSDLAKRQAMHNIALFELADSAAIVTDCATCGSSLKDYGALLADDPAWAGRARSFSGKVRDVSEFLAQIPLERPTGSFKARVTYHDPCHLRRGQGIWKEPRALLRLVEGLEFAEAPQADWCCGSAGSQLVTHYETSTKVLDRKMENLQATRPDYIASGCPGCQMQLMAGARRRKLDVEVVHPVELLARAYESAGAGTKEER
jgi:glycolate oxidase iron-sulfur subunit